MSSPANGANLTFYNAIFPRGMITPRTNGFLANNINFFNYIPNSFLIETCSVCWWMSTWN